MKGIYLTLEGKQEIQANIEEVKKPIAHYDGIYVSDKQLATIDLLEEILSSATILPVEESWDDVLSNTERTDCLYSCRVNTPQGVIIQPKQ
jgi:hypothetical protein